jgi:arylsulfatase A-like enzyme
MKRFTMAAMGLALGAACLPVEAETTKPNILMIMPDDVGYSNVGAYSHGMMVPTPNIDSIAAQGILFTDHYAEPTCTPGRAAFITGQMPIRTGLTTVGIPGSPIGISALDPTLAEVLKEKGYATGQFGKNHLGDRNEHLPTVHGFDVFYGNLYHLNSEEEPQDPDCKTPSSQPAMGHVAFSTALRQTPSIRRQTIRVQVHGASRPAPIQAP